MTNTKISALIRIAACCIAIVILIQLKAFLSLNLSSFHGDEQGFGIPCSMTGNAQEQKMTHESSDALNARLVGQAAINCGKSEMHEDLLNDSTTLAIKPPIPVTVPANTSASAMIPHKMWFTYSHNLLETNKPSLLAANVRKSIHAYKQAWDDPLAQISVYNDTMCRALLQTVEPLLVKYFDRETHGMYRGDMCRTAILYMFGGYYLDLDLEVVTPVLLNANITFATVVVDKHNVFQAFLAGTPKHPIFRKALDFMLEYYQGKRIVRGLMGTRTMRDAMDSVVKGSVVQKKEIFLLKEVNGGNVLYPTLDSWTKRKHAKGCCCNFVVHDGTTPYFFSRIVGVNLCPTPRTRVVNNNHN